MAILESPVLKTPRELLRKQWREQFEVKAQEIASGPLEGQRVVVWDDVRFILDQPFPPASDHGAEVSTPARVVVWATCPRCGIPGSLSVELTPELRVDAQGGSLHLKAKSKPVTHACGQLLLVGDQGDGQSSFELEDIIGEDGEAFALGDIVRVADHGAGNVIGPIMRFETDAEIAAAANDLGEPQSGRQIVVADPENGDHLVFAFPLDADRLTAEELEVNVWKRCDFAFCPLALEHIGEHRPLAENFEEDADGDVHSDVADGDVHSDDAS